MGRDGKHGPSIPGFDTTLQISGYELGSIQEPYLLPESWDSLQDVLGKKRQAINAAL